MKKLFQFNKKGSVPVFTFLLLVALSAATNVQTAAGASQCTFTVISPIEYNFTSSLMIGGGGSFTMSAKGNLTGACGGVHSNGDIEVGDDSLFAELGFTYVGSEKDSKGRCASGTGDICYKQVDPIDPPPVDPHKYAEFVEYQLRSDGTIWAPDGAGGWDILSASHDVYDDWSHSSDIWEKNDNEKVEGSFFVEGDIIIKLPGSAADPWTATIFCTGSIEMPVDTNIEMYNSGIADIENLFLIAGGDLKINGKPNLYGGILAAHEQIEISGDVNVVGCIIAEGAPDTADSIVHEMKTSGEWSLLCNDCSWPNPPIIVEIIEPF